MLPTTCCFTRNGGNQFVTLRMTLIRSWTWAALCRGDAAMFVEPAIRERLMVAFRQAANTDGPEPTRVRLASSPIVSSRTQ